MMQNYLNDPRDAYMNDAYMNDAMSYNAQKIGSGQVYIANGQGYGNGQGYMANGQSFGDRQVFSGDLQGYSDGNHRDIFNLNRPMDKVGERLMKVTKGFHGSNRHTSVSEPDGVDGSNYTTMFNGMNIEDLYKPFIPLLKNKPNATVPLDSTFGMDFNDPTSSYYDHPYKHEIETNTVTKTMILEIPPHTALPVASSLYTFIDTPEGLYSLQRDLENQIIFSIDIEQHKYRSYFGISCLVLISTPIHDYIIDAISLGEVVQCLNTSFTNPNILKVFHNSEKKIMWLQRDFGIYIVNMFDIGLAFSQINHSTNIDYLLKRFCSVNVDKNPSADWRVRPLDENMVNISRTYCHYLLYLFDIVKNELLKNEDPSRFNTIIYQCKEITLKKYTRKPFNKNAHMELYDNFNLNFNATQMKVFAKLYAWRDEIARRENESIRYIFPNHLLFHVSETLPTDEETLLHCCNPAPPMVNLNSKELIQMIQSELPEENDSKETKLKSDNLVGKPYIFTSAPNTNLPKPIPTSPVKKIRRRNEEKNEENSKLLPTPSQTYETSASPVLTTDQLYSTACWFEDASETDMNASVYGQSETMEADYPKYYYGDVFSERKGEFSASDMGILQNRETEYDAFSLDEIPQSMSEIYQLSNKNRKRKKKKLKETVAKPTSPLYIHDGDVEVNIRDKKRKLDSNDIESSVQFMRDIGWIGENEETPLPAADKQSKKPKQRGGRSNGNDRNRRSRGRGRGRGKSRGNRGRNQSKRGRSDHR
eukprot:TRINITY_DN5717_c0_g1_i2.p1 TRINITY_DN5717_c0_g1~~TRINITY_DN5717_c0_g1_i2.p1  ORF type:complete len:761 (-),score=147.64 TRINITY_DN5717_c0_g1_i2:73-2355(-)